MLRSGDPTAGAVLLVARYRDEAPKIFSRAMSGGDTAEWKIAAEGADPVEAFIAKQRNYDPDLWVIELDIADAERFIALSLT